MPSEVWKKMQENSASHSARGPYPPSDPALAKRREEEDRRRIEQARACEQAALRYVMEALTDIKTYHPTVSKSRKSILYPPRQFSHDLAALARLSWGDWQEGVDGLEKTFIVRIGRAYESGAGGGIDNQIGISYRSSGHNDFYHEGDFYDVYHDRFSSFDDFNAHYPDAVAIKEQRIYLGRNDTDDFLPPYGQGNNRRHPEGFNMFPSRYFKRERHDWHEVYFPREMTPADLNGGNIYTFTDWFAESLATAIYHPIMVDHHHSPPPSPPPDRPFVRYDPDWRQ